MSTPAKTQLQLVEVHGQKLTTTSLVISMLFGRSHDNVLKSLDKLVSRVKLDARDLNEALAALNIAGGRLSKSVLQAVYEPHKSGAQEVRNEAVQTAAMALRFLISLDRYEYRIGEQHKQSSEGDRFIGLRTNQLPASGMREDNLPD